MFRDRSRPFSHRPWRGVVVDRRRNWPWTVRTYLSASLPNTRVRVSYSLESEYLRKTQMIGKFQRWTRLKTSFSVELAHALNDAENQPDIPLVFFFASSLKANEIWTGSHFSFAPQCFHSEVMFLTCISRTIARFRFQNNCNNRIRINIVHRTGFPLRSEGEETSQSENISQLDLTSRTIIRFSKKMLIAPKARMPGFCRSPTCSNSPATWDKFKTRDLSGRLRSESENCVSDERNLAAAVKGMPRRCVTVERVKVV